VGGNAVFWSAVVVELAVVTIYQMKVVSFLWLNVIGALLVVAVAILLQAFFSRRVAKQ